MSRSGADRAARRVVCRSFALQVSGPAATVTFLVYEIVSKYGTQRLVAAGSLEWPVRARAWFLENWSGVRC